MAYFSNLPDVFVRTSSYRQNNVDPYKLAKNIFIDYKSFSLIGPKAWTSAEIIDLCERLSGETAQVSYIPFIAIGFLRRFFRFFEFTWNIADRLQFSEVLNSQSTLSTKNKGEIFQSFEFLTLEQYLQEYFGQILRKLKKLNYQQTQRNISFL